MAVYKRSYKAYAGDYTPEWSRYRVLARYASRHLFRSRLMTGGFVVCFFPFLVTALMLYLNHNVTLLAMFKLSGERLFTIDSDFFSRYMQVEVGFSFILTAFAGPGLVAPDLANNALVLYFCRPFSRTEYVLGKMSVLARLLSYITWIPGLILFLIESSLEGWHWMVANFYIAVAIFVSSWIVIGVLSLLALALSAWVKWKPVAGAMLLAFLFFGTGFGLAINGVMRTNEGLLISIPTLLNVITNSLFRLHPVTDLPVNQAWVALLAFSAACLYLLARKVRAYEVVK